MRSKLMYYWLLQLMFLFWVGHFIFAIVTFSIPLAIWSIGCMIITHFFLRDIERSLV